MEEDRLAVTPQPVSEPAPQTKADHRMSILYADELASQSSFGLPRTAEDPFRQRKQNFARRLELFSQAPAVPTFDGSTIQLQGRLVSLEVLRPVR